MFSRKPSAKKKVCLASGTTLACLVVALIIGLFAPNFFYQEPTSLTNLIISITTLAISTLFLIISIKRKKIDFTISPITIPILFFSLSICISLLVNYGANLEKSLVCNAGLFINFAIISILGGSLIRIKNSRLAIDLIVALAGLFSIIAFGSVIYTIATQATPNFVSESRFFSPLTSLTIILMAIASIVAIYLKKGKLLKNYLPVVTILIIGLIAQLFIVVRINQLNDLDRPSFADNWIVLTNSLTIPNQEDNNLVRSTFFENVGAFTFGRGSENFVDVFNRFKPLSINDTNNWNRNYYQGFNLPLTMIVTMGAITFTAWLILIWKTFKALVKEKNGQNHILFMLLISFFLQFFFPLDPGIIMLQAILLSFSTSFTKNTTWRLDLIGMKLPQKLKNLSKNTGQTLFYIVVGLFGLIIIWSTFEIGKTYLAYFFHKQSLKNIASLERSDLFSYYNSATRAVRLAPRIDTFNLHAAVANLEMAVYSIDLNNDQEIHHLQQAVNYARRATELNSQRTENWIIQGRIYQDVAALGSDPHTAFDWAIRSYANAILTQPNNPQPHLLLGNIYSQQQNYSQAIIFYRRALELRRNSLEGHFALGQAHNRNNEPRLALESYHHALNLLNPSDSLYEYHRNIIQTEIDNLTAQ
ncbi:MAG: tetratricopeptide repeat protein [Pseudomonadales bacterium]|jgi:tetratricopeptide (TPR) repeat protein|nr:tetratricopeptide repeat protein [Pseudomonadales bacterium]